MYGFLHVKVIVCKVICVVVYYIYTLSICTLYGVYRLDSHINLR